MAKVQNGVRTVPKISTGWCKNVTNDRRSNGRICDSKYTYPNVT